MWGVLFGFNPLMFYTETLNNYSPALGGLKYIQFCARTINLVIQTCQCISGRQDSMRLVKNITV